ncbi:hypothetical protein NFI96_003420 [Prochilodus magdalenae]|nr:hypothetical protein NFI96_003420 [Prochilodus magdalenae]
MDTEEKSVVVTAGPGTFFGLAVYGEFLFWSDWEQRAVMRSDKLTGADVMVLRADSPQQPMGLAAVANDTHSSLNSSCNVHLEFECGNGGCIDYQLTCDGVPHCKDKSDEKRQYCGEFRSSGVSCGALLRSV